MNRKGFTLIELIAVIVLLGMILLIVFPATSRLIRSNENKKYDTYYDSVQEQIELYARTRRDELGGIKGSGCVDDKKLSELKSYDYIKEFTEEKDVKCFSPGDFTDDRLQALGIKTDREYVNVRIENNNGRISVQYSMICVRNYDDPDLTSLQYKKLIEKDGICVNYVPEVTNSLLNTIKGSFTVSDVGTTSYVVDNPTNNYVWYSGKMWRIINYDLTERTIKLVTDDVVSIVNYNNKKNSDNKFVNDYSSSNIFVWLNNEFLPTLRNTEKYLLDVSWYYGSVGASVTTPITSGNSVVSKVGMLNNYEYSKGASFLNKSSNFWLLSTTSNIENAWYVKATTGAITSGNVSTFYGVRPSIVLKPNVTVINGGDGSVDNPYRLTGDIGGNIGAKLNTRYAGEYVTLNGIKFRISKADPRYTKLVAVNTLPIDSSIASTIQLIKPEDYTTTQMLLHYYDKQYSSNTFVGYYLRLWAQPIEEQLVEGDFCRMTILNTTSQTIECPQEDIINAMIAIPKIGDMFTVSTNDIYWTLNNSEIELEPVTEEDELNRPKNRKIYVVNKHDPANASNKSNSLSEKSIGQESTDKAAILPVVVIDNSVTIAGGNGTYENPYTLQ